MTINVSRLPSIPRTAITIYVMLSANWVTLAENTADIFDDQSESLLRYVWLVYVADLI